MRLVSWNINSVNARLDRLEQYLKRENPDVLCLQELKCVEEKFPYAITKALGYETLAFGQKTYNGVAILTKGSADLVSKGFGDKAFDNEARFIHARYRGLDIICAYIPNGQEVGTDRYIYKLTWLKRLETYLEALAPEAKEKLVLTGDFNVARHPDDVYDHDLLDGTLLYSQPEREALERVLAQGLSDSFRIHQPQGKSFSWWDYRGLAFPFGKGLRIDYVFLGSALVPQCSKAWIDRNERKGIKPSDHAPVGVELS